MPMFLLEEWGQLVTRLLGTLIMLHSITMPVRMETTQ
jgi:hypothetical protein